MSNQLVKLFIQEEHVIPGYTVAEWHPEQIITTTRYYGIYEYDALYTYYDPEFVNADGSLGKWFTILQHFSETVYYIGVLPSGATSFTFDTRLSLNDSPNGNPIVQITISGSDVTTETIPGYFTYTTVPDVYTYTYNPNLGWNSSARSVQSILDDGYATFSVDVSSKGVVVGLNEVPDSLSSDYFEITYGLYFADGYYQVVESGSNKTGKLTFTSSDIFTVARSNSIISYAKNNVVFYTSVTTSSVELLLDCSLYAGGDKIYNASFTVGALVEYASADFVATSGFDVISEKAAASFTFISDFASNGIYSDGDDVHATGSFVATSELSVKPVFLTASFIATSDFTATGRLGAEIIGSLSSLVCSAADHVVAEIVVSMSPLRARASTGELSNTITYIAAALLPMSATATSLVGGNTVDTVMSMSPMVAQLADADYAEIAVSMKPMTIVAGVYADLGNTIVGKIPKFTLSMTGTWIEPSVFDITIPDFSGSMLGGAIFDCTIQAFDITLTGSAEETASFDLQIDTPTLAMTGDEDLTGAFDLILNDFSGEMLGGGEFDCIFPDWSAMLSGSIVETGDIECTIPDFLLDMAGSFSDTGNIEIQIPDMTGYLGIGNSIKIIIPAFTAKSTGRVT